MPAGMFLMSTARKAKAEIKIASSSPQTIFLFIWIFVMCSLNNFRAIINISIIALFGFFETEHNSMGEKYFLWYNLLVL
jgi:hypothetical protein